MEAKNLEQLEFSLDSVIDLSSTSPSSSSPVELRFQQSDSTHCFTFDLASAQLFKFGTVQFICNNSEEKAFSQGVNIKFESEKDNSKESCEEWRKDAPVHQGGSSSTVSASKSMFDEASSAKMDFHYNGQQKYMLQGYVRTGKKIMAFICNRSNFAGRVVVVDVGAGSGILSMFAAQAGAKHAVEASEMAEYARKLIAGNPLFADRITVIIRPPRSISTLLVNERMLESYVIARDRFMSPNAKMFPTVGRIHMADELLFIEKANKALFRQQDNYCGVDLTPLFGSAHQGYFSQSVVDAFDPRLLVAPSMFRKRSGSGSPQPDFG
ncbi:probable histone-arginine methyltransferase 1.3 [Raphanus sativus]|uniref:type I protein arginine methyltransferase n=1 Tax=Raphanus sativus TaxID=3726 RepID=A0A9W3C748_RAPSA|nr:probable histone-arginine methyltransferase 1.3 [Raphanus sativus]